MIYEIVDLEKFIFGCEMRFILFRLDELGFKCYDFHTGRIGTYQEYVNSILYNIIDNFPKKQYFFTEKVKSQLSYLVIYDKYKRVIAKDIKLKKHQ